MEQYRIRKWRCNYLRKVKKAKEEGKYLIYLDETWFNVGEAAEKIWSDGTHYCTQASVNGGEHLIVVHAGSVEGWVSDGLLVLRT